MDDENAKFFGVVILIVVLVVGATAVAYDAGREAVRKEAVRIGHAEYTSDAAGKPSFTWRELDSE